MSFDIAHALSGLLEALNNAHVGFVVFRAQNGVAEKVYANQTLVSSLGYSVDEWLATPLWHVIPEDKKTSVMQIFERLIFDAPIPPAIEVSLMHKDGHEVQAEVAAGRVVAGDGARLLVFVVRDMHRQTQLSLLEADRIALVGALAAGFAHETNNPLTSVLLNLRSLRKQMLNNLTDVPQANALRCLDDITTGAERIASNVRALQTLATRSATGKIDLAAVVSAALRLAAPTLEPRAHVIRQIFPVPPVAGEESRIGQAVLAMLLFSSSGFDGELSSASNRIVVAVEEREGNAVVEVSDNGRDLTGEEALHAFDPFFRSPVRGAGVGVGLGVARSVAITLGGEVTLAQRNGGGAVITMRLPATPDKPPVL
ncbi:MAG TPA: ATP-binding protein [Kofleriaceae bacterium]|nr:ATP-binding protein [Kofleriaceae bacterium]